MVLEQYWPAIHDVHTAADEGSQQEKRKVTSAMLKAHVILPFGLR